MGKLQLGCQTSSGIGIGSDICDGLEVVVVGLDGSGSVSGSNHSNIHAQLLLKFRTVYCTVQ